MATGDAKVQDDEFDEWLASLRPGEDGVVKVLAWPADSNPDLRQRLRLNELASAHPVKIAVLTDSMIARGAARAIGWLGKIDIRAFEPGDNAAALGWLGVDERSLAPLVTAVSDLRHRAIGAEIREAS